MWRPLIWYLTSGHSIRGEVDTMQRRVVEGNTRRVEGLVKKGDMVVVTSCN